VTTASATGAAPLSDEDCLELGTRLVRAVSRAMAADSRASKAVDRRQWWTAIRNALQSAAEEPTFGAGVETMLGPLQVSDVHEDFSRELAAIGEWLAGRGWARFRAFIRTSGYYVVALAQAERAAAREG